MHSASFTKLPGRKAKPYKLPGLPCMNRLINDNHMLTMLWVCPDILQLEPGTSGRTTHCRAQGGSPRSKQTPLCWRVRKCCVNRACQQIWGWLAPSWLLCVKILKNPDTSRGHLGLQDSQSYPVSREERSCLKKLKPNHSPKSQVN